MKPYRIAAIPGDGIGLKSSDVTATVIDAIYGANA
jgi:isocitrate/isopropylmalate dehydrogenase